MTTEKTFHCFQCEYFCNENAIPNQHLTSNKLLSNSQTIEPNWTQIVNIDWYEAYSKNCWSAAQTKLCALYNNDSWYPPNDLRRITWTSRRQFTRSHYKNGEDQRLTTVNNYNTWTFMAHARQHLQCLKSTSLFLLNDGYSTVCASISTLP